MSLQAFVTRIVFVSLVAVFMFIGCTQAFAADANQESAPRGDVPTDGAPVTISPQEQGDSDNAGFEQAVYPGVVNRHLERGGNGSPSVSLYYPQFGQDAVDAAMAAFVEEEADDYEKEVNQYLSPDADKPATYDMWDMNGIYTLSRPNPEVVSATFNIYSYSGGAHGNLLIHCLNYDLRNGKLLELGDLFADQAAALKLLGELSAQKLRKELGDDVEEEMLQSGTAPEPDNFANISLLPDGILIEFQPYQVGPWSIGPQHVKLSLEELASLNPNPAIWPAPGDATNGVKNDDTPESGTEMPAAAK